MLIQDYRFINLKILERKVVIKAILTHLADFFIIWEKIYMEM